MALVTTSPLLEYQSDQYYIVFFIEEIITDLIIKQVSKILAINGDTIGIKKPAQWLVLFFTEKAFCYCRFSIFKISAI